MSIDENKADPQPENTSAAETDGNLAGMDHVGDDDTAQAPEDDVAIRLPIEEGDFNAQTG